MWGKKIYSSVKIYRVVWAMAEYIEFYLFALADVFLEDWKSFVGFFLFALFCSII